MSLPAETLAEEVRHLDKEGPAVASEDGLKLPGEGAEAIAAEVVVAAKIERRSRVGCPAEQKLSADIGVERLVVNARRDSYKLNSVDAFRGTFYVSQH